MTRNRKATGPHTNGAVAEHPPVERHEAASSNELDLTETERLLVSGIFARLQLIQRTVLDPYNADAAQVNAIIEATHGLQPGAIGMTHRINPETMCLDVVLEPALPSTD